MGAIGDLFGGGGDDAAKASEEAAETQAQYQREALEYLKEREALPQAYREAALGRLGAEFGVSPDGGDGRTISERARESELYKALLGGREAGEEAILRKASATGGLRSGNVQSALYDYNTQLENQAFLTSYNNQLQGIQGLAGLPSLAPQIAQGTTGIGTTLAQGQIAAAQAQAQGQQAGIGNALGLGQLALQAYSTFSDRRLKTNIALIGHRGGVPFYRWTWNARAEELGVSGECEGIIAQDIENIIPNAVYELDNGYKAVDMSIVEGYINAVSIRAGDESTAAA